MKHVAVVCSGLLGQTWSAILDKKKLAAHAEAN